MKKIILLVVFIASVSINFSFAQDTVPAHLTNSKEVAADIAEALKNARNKGGGKRYNSTPPVNKTDVLVNIEGDTTYLQPEINIINLAEKNKQNGNSDGLLIVFGILGFVAAVGIIFYFINHNGGGVNNQPIRNQNHINNQTAQVLTGPGGWSSYRGPDGTLAMMVVNESNEYTAAAIQARTQNNIQPMPPAQPNP